MRSRPRWRSCSPRRPATSPDTRSRSTAASWQRACLTPDHSHPDGKPGTSHQRGTPTVNDNRPTAVLELVDLDHGQARAEAAEADFLTTHTVSGRDQAAYALADDVVTDYKLCADSLPQDDVPVGDYY